MSEVRIESDNDVKIYNLLHYSIIPSKSSLLLELYTDVGRIKYELQSDTLGNDISGIKEFIAVELLDTTAGKKIFRIYESPEKYKIHIGDKAIGRQFTAYRI